MRFDIHVFHHIAEDGATERKLDKVLAALASLAKENLEMNTNLSSAVAALAASVAPLKDQLDSIETYVRGVPEIVATAVAEALAAADVAADEAAELVNNARSTIEAEVGEALGAITTPGGGEQTEPGEDTETDPTDPEPVEGEPGEDSLAG